MLCSFAVDTRVVALLSPIKERREGPFSIMPLGDAAGLLVPSLQEASVGPVLLDRRLQRWMSGSFTLLKLLLSVSLALSGAPVRESSSQPLMRALRTAGQEVVCGGLCNIQSWSSNMQ